jgi:hypothetical protein
VDLAADLDRVVTIILIVPIENPTSTQSLQSHNHTNSHKNFYCVRLVALYHITLKRDRSHYEQSSNVKWFCFSASDVRFRLTELLLNEELEYNALLGSAGELYGGPLKKLSSLSPDEHLLLFGGFASLADISRQLCVQVNSRNSHTSCLFQNNVFSDAFPTTWCICCLSEIIAVIMLGRNVERSSLVLV